MTVRALARAILLSVLGLGLVIPGVGAGASTPPSTAPGPALAGLQPMVVSTQLWVGTNDLLLDLLDADGARLDDPGLTGDIDLLGPDGLTRGAYPLERIRLAGRGRYLYRARIPLDAVGPWSARVATLTSAGRPLEGEARFQVLDDAGTPGLGQPAIPVRTPTITGSSLAAISSDRDPVPQLYWWSLDDAIRAGRPILYVIDTARLGVNDACGSAMGEARILRGSFPGLVVIHAEPFVVGDTDTVLTDPSQGPAQAAPWATAWGVSDPPWMFLIAPDGTVHAKFQGVFGTDELLSALRHIAPYAPGGH